MAKDPAFLFYPGDFNTGTQFFTDEQVGKYMRLLMAQHQHGHLTEKQVIIICKSYDNDVMLKFKKDSDGLWFNERLEIEMQKRKEYSKSRSENRKKDTNPKNISSSYVQHMENENENRDENENGSVNIWPAFSDFWDLYDKKIDRPKCESKWKKIAQGAREEIMIHLDAYIKSTPDRQYRKNPATYLNNESWKNEIINNGKATIKPTREQRNAYIEAKYGTPGATEG